ncbi:MAG: translesion error-prone DNA polymerase V autoproteolytic subunit [Balneolia bacterium]|nr:translesion error-prone DNA polymerase V autoproteolytic subunit [Balneolia bacterium]
MKVTDIQPLESSENSHRTEDKPALYGNTVEAGFPSPAQDHIERQLDLNEYLVKHPVATFFVRVQGESMNAANILSGDVLIVDRSLEPSHNRIVVAVLNGEFTVKKLQRDKDTGAITLLPESDDPQFKPVEITEESDFEVWGVVTYVIHSFIS